MKDGKVVLAAAFGFSLGVFVTAAGAAKFVQAMVKQDRLIAERNLNMFNHMIETMGPYCPQEVLEENYVYLEFQNMVMHEKGKEE